MPPRIRRLTPTERMKAALELDGFGKSIMAEQLRAMIRMYGIGGIKDGAIDQLFYEILFLDPLTPRHFGRFQPMWEHRNNTQPPFLEWWTQFQAFVRDCLDKTRASNNRYQEEKWTAYEANDVDFYDSPAFDWPTLAADAEARARWFPQPRYRTPPTIPAHHAGRAGSGAARGVSLLGLRIFLINPGTFAQRPQRADNYPLWSANTVEVTQSVVAYTLPTIFAAVVAVCPVDRHPRVIYGCRLNPRNPEDGEDEDGDIPAAIETQARLTGATYRLQPRDTVQLTSNATVSAWATAAVGAAHHTPTVIAILERLRGADTLPRDMDVHLNSRSIPMPVHRSPAPPVQAPPPLQQDSDDDDEDEVDRESGSEVDRGGRGEDSEEEESEEEGDEEESEEEGGEEDGDGA
jgi:hypothetical protein